MKFKSPVPKRQGAFAQAPKQENLLDRLLPPPPINESTCSTCGKDVLDDETYFGYTPSSVNPVPVCFQCYYQAVRPGTYEPEPPYPEDPESPALDTSLNRPYGARLAQGDPEGFDSDPNNDADREGGIVRYPIRYAEAANQRAIGRKLEKEHFKPGKTDSTPDEVAATHLRENPHYYPTSKRPEGAKEALRWVTRHA